MAVVTEKENSMYSLLSDESKKAVDLFVAFLLQNQESAAQDTLCVLKECLEGKNLVGPFTSVDDLMRDLNGT